MASERAVLEKHMEKMVDWVQDRCDEEKMVMVLVQACTDKRAGRAVEEMWMKSTCCS